VSNEDLKKINQRLGLDENSTLADAYRAVAESEQFSPEVRKQARQALEANAASRLKYPTLWQNLFWEQAEIQKHALPTKPGFVRTFS
jgi:hypothetical protein